LKLKVVERDDKLSRIELVGEFDTRGAQKVESEFSKQVYAAKTHTILDLSKLSYIASLGISMLVTAYKTLAMNDKKFILLNPSSDVKHVLETTRIAWPIKLLKALGKDDQVIEILKDALDFGDVAFDQAKVDKFPAKKWQFLCGFLPDCR